MIDFSKIILQDQMPPRISNPGYAHDKDKDGCSTDYFITINFINRSERNWPPLICLT